MNRFTYDSGFFQESFPNYPEPFDPFDYDSIDPTDLLLLDKSFHVELREIENNFEN